jgi:hypothetical protein
LPDGDTLHQFPGDSQAGEDHAARLPTLPDLKCCPNVLVERYAVVEMMPPVVD